MGYRGDKNTKLRKEIKWLKCENKKHTDSIKMLKGFDKARQELIIELFKNIDNELEERLDGVLRLVYKIDYEYKRDIERLEERLKNIGWLFVACLVVGLIRLFI